METIRIHLIGANHSGRAVRIKTLSSDEIDAIEALAQGDVKDGDTILSYHSNVAKYGIARLVVAYTEPVTANRFAGKPEKKDGKVEPFNWVPMDPATFEDQGNKLFTPRDLGTFRILYRRAYVVSEADVDTILAGKVQETSE